MKASRARAFRFLLSAFALLLVAGLIAPKFHADRYRERIKTALETALARKVSFGEIRFDLLTGPGFTVRDVVIEDDPALGAEPIAYVGQLEASPRLWSLLTGHLAFSSLRLEDAFLNLSRADIRAGEYRWNFEPLLRPAVVAAFPNISIRGARINFKAGNVKSMVYVLDSNLDVRPPSSPEGAWVFQFQGKPARSDRPARGSGGLRARGNWRPGLVDLDVELESSELGDMVALVRGEDIGLHGLISGRAKLKGPTAKIGIEGRMRIEDLHGWDQSVPKGENWPLDLSGRWNLPAQQLELDARVAGDTDRPVLKVHYLVEQYVTQPRWGVSIELNHFAVDPLVSLARHLGAPVPDGLKFNGLADGVIGYSVQKGVSGQAALHHAQVAPAGSPALQIDEAQVMVADGQVHLQPAQVVSADRETAVVEAIYDIGSQRANVKIRSEAMNVAALGKQATLASIPLLSQFSSGRWGGELNYTARPGDAPLWSGDVALTAAAVNFPAFSEVIRINSARAHLDEDGVFLERLRAVVGDLPVQGDYRYQNGAARPHRFHLAVDAVSGTDLETLLKPVLLRNPGLFGMAIRFGRSSVPAWLANWHAEGTLQARELTLSTIELDRVHTRVLWDSTYVAMPELAAQMASGDLKARVYIDLSNATPAYEAFSVLTGAEWKGGKLDADVSLQTHGSGSALLTNIRSNGSFAGHSVLDDVESVTGKYEFGWRALTPQLALSDLRIDSADGSYTGNGGLQTDGTLLLRLTSGAKQMRVAGTLSSQGTLHWLQ